MAQLAKRTTVVGRGGAGPFHYPQKPGRHNHLSAGPIGRRELAAQLVTAQPRALRLVHSRQEKRGLARRALDKLTRRAA